MANEDLLPDLVNADISNINPRDAITAALIERSSLAPQMTPEMRARLQTIVQGEVGHGATPEQQQVQLETTLNRALARGQPLEQVTRQYTGPGSSGYYPASTFVGGRIRSPDEFERFQRSVVDPVLAGSDVGTQRLGFAPTGNASGGVAARGIASGRYNQAGVLGGETYVQQETPAQLARLAALRGQGGGRFNVPAGAPTLTANDLSQDPAFAPGAPPIQVAQADTGTVSDAGNPPIPTEITKAPEQPPQQFAPRPSQLPFPQFEYVESEPLGPKPEQPKPLPPSDAMEYATRYMNNPDVSEGTRAYFKRLYDVEESYRKELETRATAKYTNDLAQWNKTADEIEKRRVNKPKDIADLYNALIGGEKTAGDVEEQRYKQTQRPITEAQAKATLAETVRKATEPTYKDYQGTGYQIPPGGGPMTRIPGSPDPTLGDKAQEAVAFATLVKPDLKELDEKLNYGAPLTSRFDRFLDQWVPIYGHEWASQAYHSAEQKIGSFNGAFMRMRSGGAVTDSEAARNLPSITPMPGDTQQDLEEKSRRRHLLVDGALAAAGSEAKARAEALSRNLEKEFYANRARAADGKDPIKTFSETAGPQPVPVRTPDEARALPAGTPIILPDGRTGISPGPKQQAGP